ncbi:hypothetical protein ES703_23996 [subsurface metagenome]
MTLNLSRNWDSKKNIVAPIIVNLITAFLIFLLVVLFKEPIYNLIKPEPTVEEFPLYCVAEPYNNEDGEVISDFFIINLRGRRYTEKDLEGISKMASRDQDVEIKPHIKIAWKGKEGNIRDITEDKEFNDEKGKIEIIPPEKGNGEWIINVKEITPKGILKVIISTDYERTITPAAKASLPFKYVYPGD